MPSLPASWSQLGAPPQVQLHLTLALGAGYQTSEKPATAALVESVLSRHGDRLKDMVEQFDAKAAEIRALFTNQAPFHLQLL